MSDRRVNRSIELLAADQPVYYTGGHTGAVLTHEQGMQDARTWADYINVGMEHGCFDLAGLARYMAGLVAGGPTASSHRTPTVIVEAPVDGTSEPVIRYNAWQFRQILARGVHGILLCQAETSDAVRGVAHIEQMLAVPGLGFAECGPGDLHMSYGVERIEGQHDPRVIEASERVRAACAANGVAFLDVCTPDNITSQIDRGVRVVAGGREQIARIGRAHTGRTLPAG